jgi:hypothetical protein
MAAASGSVNGYLSSIDWTTFNGKQNALGFTPANNTININTSSPLQGGGNLTGDRTISILPASQTQSGIVTTSSQLFGGSKVFKNRVTIDSVFTLNTTSSIPTQILGINTTGNVNSVGKFTLGNGLNITLGGTLQADTTFLFTQSDTLSLNLTSRFAAKQNTLNGTGFVKASGTNITYDNSSYLRTGLADSSYLKLTGGTLTGALTGTTAEFISASSQITLSHSGTGQNNILFKSGSNEIFKMGIASNNSSIIFENLPLSQKTSGFKFYSVSGSTQTLGLDQDINGNLGIKSESTPNSLHPNTLYVDGTLGVTGAATLSSTLAVQGDITEDGNNVLTSADTTTMLTPYIERGDTATMLNPYWRSGRFSGTLPIANGGTGAESASVARTTLAVGYVFSEVTAGTVVLLTSNRVSLVNTGGSSTTQLDLTPATNGRMYMIKNLASGTVVSDASNVIPFNGGSAGTAILGAGNVTPQWCTLVADGTNWHIMQAN